MTTVEKDPFKDRKVSDLSVDELLSAINSIVEASRPPVGDRISDLSVKDFTALMLDQLKDRAYTTAQAERDVADRILEDWKKLLQVEAVTLPFRVKSKEEVEQVSANMKKTFVPGFRGELVVVIAVAHTSGQVTKLE